MVIEAYQVSMCSCYDVWNGFYLYLLSSYEIVKVLRHKGLVEILPKSEISRFLENAKFPFSTIRRDNIIGWYVKLT